jgi:signal peptidase II
MVMSMIMARLGARISFYIVAVLVVLVDQISKLLVRMYIPLGSSVPNNNDFFRFTYITNKGGVWSLFQGHLPWLIAMSFVGLAAVLICFYFFAYRWRIASIGLGLILGGTIGNQIDRLWMREVTDFIDWGSWPVFNIADSAGVIGVAVIIVFLFFFYKENMDKDSEQS